MGFWATFHVLWPVVRSVLSGGYGFLRLDFINVRIISQDENHQRDPEIADNIEERNKEVHAFPYRESNPGRLGENPGILTARPYGNCL